MTNATLTTAHQQTVNIVREDDIVEHIEDTRLFWVVRNGRAIKRAWNELTATERREQEEAERRDYFCRLFDIY